jgi:ribonuclease P protein component
MLPKQYRLPLRTEFKRIKKNGRLFSGKFFSLLIAPQPQTSRFAFIISKKIHQKATKRNKARRLLVEAVRSILPQIKPGFDFVFLVKKTIVGKELSEIKKEVKKIFKNEKIYFKLD